MQLIMLLLAFVATVIAIPFSPDPVCHNVTYDPTKYQCYSDLLCPITNGDVQRPCGPACYSQYNYTCSTNHTLVPLPHAQGPFLLQVLASNQNLNGKYVQACTRRFWVGEGPCTSCPQNVSQAGKCPQGDQTQLFEGSGMNVEVAGGQRYYLAPDGAFSFTAANSSYVPHDSIFNATAYQEGMFVYDEPKHPPSTWIACPKINGSTAMGSRAVVQGVWQIFGKLKGVDFPARQQCEGVTLLARAGEKEFIGAYEYT